MAYRVLGPDDVCLKCGASDWMPYQHANGRTYLRCRPCLLAWRRKYRRQRHWAAKAATEAARMLPRPPVPAVPR
jgi:hypothetical protein